MYMKIKAEHCVIYFAESAPSYIGNFSIGEGIVFVGAFIGYSQEKDKFYYHEKSSLILEAKNNTWNIEYEFDKNKWDLIWQQKSGASILHTMEKVEQYFDAL